MKIPRALLLCLLVASGAANAASLFVRPTTVMLARGQSAATVTVTNSSSAPVTAQLRLYSWNQADNQDSLTSTEAMVASPPMLQIPPGSSQTIRLVRVAAAPAVTEESYRLIVDEVPEPGAGTEGTGVVVQLRYSVPVFVLPRSSPTALTTFKATVDGGSLLLDVANRGKAHAQISNVRLTYPNGSSEVVGAGLVGYVLPDKQRQWKLGLPAPDGNRGAPTQVRAQVNGKDLRVAL